MKCPVDETELSMSARQGIEIDYCPKCRGVWLDRGELDKIIERSAAEVAARPPPPHEHAGRARHESEYRGDYRGGYKKRKRESFLDDLFDF